MNLDKFEEDGNTYFHLCISCPVCHDQGRNTERAFWSHYDNNCHGDIYVGDNAHFKCKKCGQSFHIKNWGYCCPCHSNSSDFEMGIVPTAIDSGILVARSISQMVNDCGILWLQRFMDNVDER